ncbi:MAG TPA: hypothetical protein VGQ57_01245 [Polyangiaceae bacterium]|nr:hypothetical protein [Polyangiaceae bacterium]
MIEELVDLDPDIVDALRADAPLVAPTELRQRVAARLAVSAGVVGLGTMVAGVSKAAVVPAVAASTAAASTGGATLATTAAASGTAAGAPLAASGAAALGMTGLVKTLGFGMALGSVVGLGLHAGYRVFGTPPAAVAAGVAPQRVTAPNGAARRVTAPDVVAPAGEQPPVAASSVAPEPPTEPLPEGSRLDKARSPTAASPRMNPGPELPGDGPAARGTGLAEQQALLDQARAALRRGDGAAALDAVRQHLARFPRTAFEEEREAVAIKALVMLGAGDEARRRVAQFAQRYPKSLLLPALKAALGSRGKE